MINLFNLFRPARDYSPDDEPLPILNDTVFKAMLASDTEDSREALRSLLCACTGREITEVKVVNSELLPAHMDAKFPRLDVHVTFNDGEAAALEMQIGKSDDDLKDRAAYYASALYSGQSRRGMKYKRIKRVYQIFFLNCVLFPESEKLPRRYGYREEKEHDLLTEAVEIIYYELPKLEKRVEEYFAGKAGTENLSMDEKWCIFMKYRHEKRVEPLIKELCREEEGIMHAEKSVVKISRSYIRFARELATIKCNMESEAKERQLIEEGRAEGQTEGKRENTLQIARNLLAEGSTPDFVQKITGLSIEEIEKLQG
ncbi:MAG: Rpn family recombination-promoting nuclease/putative transposase [Treponema sp.]|jgi:predicted transposase/invertase (TIGR01784 family)|nr:Rpn family recombination-promoting nuclease/putative transposase [Treponema sp.]